MLVLSRKVGESIEIDGGITVTLLSQRGSGVRLGIEAPSATQIVRSELLERPIRDLLLECQAKAASTAESFTDEPRLEVKIPIEWQPQEAAP